MSAWQERVAALRARLASMGLPALVVSAPSNVFYLSGFRGSAGALLVSSERAVLFSDFRYRLQAREQAPDWEFHEVERRLLRTLGAAAREMCLTRLGYDPGHLTCEQRDELAKGAEGLELVPAGGLVEELRAVKSPEEVARIRRAAELADRALARMVDLLAPGTTEREIALEGEVLMRREGAEAAAFDIIVASGPRSALPHAEAGDRALAAGDLVVMDLGARVDGYCSDITRTYAVREASAQAREVYALVYRAQRAGAAAVRAGARCEEVDAVARRVIEEAGHREHFGHSLGHGVGIEVHEAPRLASTEDAPLVAGQVLTVEPGVYLEGIGGVRLEDLLLVTGEGAETLTGSPLPEELPVV